MASLRKHYHGPIRLYAEGSFPEGIAVVLDELSVDIIELPKSDEATLVVKAGLWRCLKDDLSLYLDSDTVVCAPVDELFDRLEEHGHVVTKFWDWDTSHKLINWRIRNWTRVIPDLIEPALDYGWALNTGVQGWRQDNPLLADYEKLTRAGHAADRFPIVLDEIAMQLLIPHHPHYLADSSWNVSGQYDDLESARIVHYHGRRHWRADNPRTEVWKRQHRELLDRFPNSDALRQPWGDEALSEYLAREDSVR